MSANVIPFRAHDAPLKGVERHEAIRAYWKTAQAIAAQTAAEAFSAVSRQSGCGGLSCEDAMPLFVAAFRRELLKSGY